MHPELEHLDRLASQLEYRSIDLGSVLDEMRVTAREALQADRATVYLVDHVRGEMVSRSVDLPGLNQIRLRIGEGLAGQVAETGHPLRLGKDDERTDAARRVDATTGYRTRTMLAVPILDGERVIGVLQILNKQRGDFTLDDEDRLLLISERFTTVLGATSLASQLDANSQRPLEFQFNHIIGDAPSMRELYALISRAARTDITVLLRGESGTGKTLAARALHDNSLRRNAPFVAVDCAAIPEHLIENELFGHEEGAYTGADKAADGKVAAAEGGTLFLDEVGELSSQSQKKILRLLQEKTYFPVGATHTRKADVRFVCATNRNLEEAVEEGTFRKDLLFRLRVVELEVPALRTRGAEDVDRLIDHYLYAFARQHGLGPMQLSATARRKLHDYPWPGNVRELRHVLEAAVVLAPATKLDPVDIRLPATGPVVSDATPEGFVVPKPAPIRDVIANYATWTLEQCDGNRSEAARVLGISRTTLGSYLKR